MPESERLIRADSAILTRGFDKNNSVVMATLVEVEQALAMQQLIPIDVSEKSVAEGILIDAVRQKNARKKISLDQAAHILRQVGVIDF